MSTHNPSERIDWKRMLPFFLLHAACFAAFWVGVSRTALTVCVVLYFVRMFAITAFYHRYFSHRTYKTTRLAQFVFAVLGASAAQRGPIWWAAHHRHHHRHSDKPGDIHSPFRRGFLWSHMGWFMSKQHFTADSSRVRDLLLFPELRFLDRFDEVVPSLLASSLVVLGMVLHRWAPSLHTNGPQLLVWGFCISTVALYHGTYTINSLSHVFGRQRYKTGDHSRNNPWLALLTLGEGWHNNHHYYPAATQQGFYWWEIDLTFYGLKLISYLGIIWELRKVPHAIRDKTFRLEHECSTANLPG
jgi:stearoyl-CoA desaturase (Delta-9 desaturase)